MFELQYFTIFLFKSIPLLNNGIPDKCFLDLQGSKNFTKQKERNLT